jgi:DNA-binding NarL/FixJ family response regulator
MTNPVETVPTRRNLRVVVADDDTFIVSLVADGLRAQGFDVTTASAIPEAWELVAGGDPHALVSDLNFGGGESGAQLLRRVHEEFPWVGLVVLTSHHSPELAVDDAGELPRGIVYLVKSRLRAVEDLAQAVNDAIAETDARDDRTTGSAHTLVLTAAQADVLRMLASGASTRALAEARGTTIRAAETMLTRLYSALGLGPDDSVNPRVAAVHLWQQGRVSVR